MTSPRPRYATPRNPDRPTFGPSAGKVARVLRSPFMPWQDQAADVALEVDPATGLYYYRTVLITVPRQAGKTTIGLVAPTTKCLIRPNTLAWHTADRGLKARKKVLDYLDAASQTPLGAAYTTKRGAGDTVARFFNGSQLRPFPPTSESLHQEQSDHVNIDEAWSHSPERGAALLQAIGPTQATRPGAQVWIFSTAGDATSTWWHEMLDSGPEQGRTAVLDWGIPDDADPTDIDLVASCHPAIGHTIDRAFLESELDSMGPDEFARAYGNRRTRSKSRVFAREVWEGLRSDELVPEGARVAFGAAIAADRSRTAIVAAAEMEDGTPLGVVIDSRPGTSWGAQRCEELVERYHHADLLAVDRVGPSTTLWDELDQADVGMLPLGSRDVSAATGDLIDRVRDGRIRIRPDAALDEAVDAAALRADMRMWDREKSAGPIPELEALTLAVWALAHRDEESAEPVIIFAQG